MKNYRITVNGTAYDVAVEELAEGAVASQPVAAPKAAPAAPKAAPKATPAAGAAGAVKVNAPMPGKVLSVKAAVGQAVKKGDVLLLIEAMKLENEVNAPFDGEVVEVLVNKGQNVTNQQLLVKIK